MGTRKQQINYDIVTLRALHNTFLQLQENPWVTHHLPFE